MKDTDKYLILILLCAFTVRLHGIGFGIPYFVNPDESYYLPKALEMLANLNFNPGHFKNPPLLKYIYAGASCIYFVIWKAASALVSLPDFRALWENNPLSFYYMARGIAVVFGVSTCYLLYLAGMRLFNKTVGLISSALLAFSFLHARDSHYAVNDVPAVFFMTLAFYYLIKVFLEWKDKDAMLAGIFSGMAIATKYNMGIILVSFFAVYLARYRRGEKQGGLTKLLIYVASCSLSFFICCPWILLDAARFFGDFMWQFSLSKTGWWWRSLESSYLQLLKTLLWGYGAVPFVLSIAGGAALLMKKRQVFMVLWSFPLVYYVLLGASKLFFVRIAMPLLPFLCLSSAYGLWLILDRYYKGHKAIACALLLLAVLQGMIFTIQYNVLIGRVDRRVAAREWIWNNIPSGSRIVAEGYSPRLRDFAQDREPRSYDVKDVWADLPKHGVFEYRSEGYRYIVTSDFMRTRYEFDGNRYPEESSFYEGLDKSCKMVYSSDMPDSDASFAVDDIYSPFWNIFKLHIPGPRIRVYDIGTPR